MTSIKFKLTREDSDDAAATGGGASSVPTSSGIPGDFLTPHLLAPRNSLTSATGFIGKFCRKLPQLNIFVSEYTIRRRRPITLRIMPRLSLPVRSTSAPASTSESEWPPVR